MKIWWTAFYVLHATVVAENATAEADAQAEAIEQLLLSMPTCGLACLQGAVAASPCSPTDIECSCSNTTLTGQVELCVATRCSIKNSLATKNVTSTLCQAPVRNHTHLVSYIGVAGAIIAFIAYLLRIVSKAVGEGKFFANLGWDDATITFAVAMMIPVSVFSPILANLGLGRDMWAVPFPNITKILEIYYIDELLYLALLPVIKISILMTYLRIFQGQAFRIWVYVAIGLNVCYMIAFDLITAFQCRPISYSWTRWDGEHEGKCNNINAQIFAAAALNVTLDFLVIGLPMPQLWKMNMNWRKKGLVMLMFGVGFFVTIVSILRLQYLIQFGHSTNVTWDYTRIGYWSTIEMHTSILCACMPAIRKLIKSVFPRMMGATTRGIGTNSALSGLSGPTALNSGTEKNNSQANVRRKSSDLSNFIPLEEYSRSHHVRNFSQPHEQEYQQSYQDSSNAPKRGYGYAM